jgi:hypothetical protein
LQAAAAVVLMHLAAAVVQVDLSHLLRNQLRQQLTQSQLAVAVRELLQAAQVQPTALILNLVH